MSASRRNFLRGVKLADRSDKTIPFLGDLKIHRAVRTGDLVTIAMYETASGENMVGSPDWLDNRSPVNSNAPNSKSRTRAVSALVVESHPRFTGPNRKMLHVVCEGKRILVPLASVVEVYERE